MLQVLAALTTSATVCRTRNWRKCVRNGILPARPDINESKQTATVVQNTNAFVTCVFLKEVFFL